MKLIWILLISLLSSCSAQWHLKRAIEKDPTIMDQKIIHVIDTLVLSDSVTYYDTFVAKETDTIRIDNQKSQIVIFKYKNRYQVMTKIKSDTIRIKQNVLIPTIKYVQNKEIDITLYLFIALFGIVFGVYMGSKNDK